MATNGEDQWVVEVVGFVGGASGLRRTAREIVVDTIGPMSRDEAERQGDRVAAVVAVSHQWTRVRRVSDV